MSRQSQLSPDNILRFLQLRNGPASLEDLSRSLQVRKSSRRALLQKLANSVIENHPDEDAETVATDGQLAIAAFTQRLLR